MGIFKRLFGGKESGQASLALLGTDIHSHLVPGVDDGSQSIEDSVGMIRELVALGYKKLITTPHVMSDAYRNTPETILGGLDQVRVALEAAGIEVEMAGAAEYYLDEQFIKKIGKEELLTFGGEKKYILFETSYVEQPMSMHNAIFQLIGAGYTPVLAHPERYQYHWNDEGMEAIRELRGRGVLMQVNIGSFAGRYSKRAAKIADEMAREDMIEFLGTDIHRIQQVESIHRALRNNRALAYLLENGILRNSSL